MNGIVGEAPAALSREQKLELWKQKKGKSTTPSAQPSRRPLGAISSSQANSKRARHSVSGGGDGISDSRAIKTKSRPSSRSSTSSLESTADSGNTSVSEASENSLDSSAIDTSTSRVSIFSLANTAASEEGLHQTSIDDQNASSSKWDVQSADGGDSDVELSVDDSTGGDLTADGSVLLGEEKANEVGGGGEVTLGILGFINEVSQESLLPQQPECVATEVQFSEAAETDAVVSNAGDDVEETASFSTMNPQADEGALSAAERAPEVASRGLLDGDAAKVEVDVQLARTSARLAECTALLRVVMQENERLSAQADDIGELRLRCTVLEGAAKDLSHEAPSQASDAAAALGATSEETIGHLRAQMAQQASDFAEERGRIVAKLITAEERARKAEAAVVAAEKEAEVAVHEADEHWQGLFDTQMKVLQQQLALALAAKAAAPAAVKPTE